MRGRLPTPTALKIIRGNPGKQKLPVGEPVPPPGDAEMPTWLSARGRRFWRRLSPVLRSMGCLTSADGEGLAVLCETLNEFVQASKDVRKRGAIVDGRANPSVAMANAAGQRVRLMMAEYGLTPSSRSRIKAGATEVPASKWEGLLSS